MSFCRIKHKTVKLCVVCAAEPSIAEPSMAEPSVAEPSMAEPGLAGLLREDHLVETYLNYTCSSQVLG